MRHRRHEPRIIAVRQVCALAMAFVACADDGVEIDDSTSEGTGSSTAPATITAAVTTTPPDSSGDSSSGAASTTADSSSTTTTSSGSSSGSESSSTGDPVDALDDDAIERIHDAVAASLGTGYATGCAIAIWRDGAVIYAEGFGTKDEAGNPVTNDTLFQIGSDTKKMVAMTALQQVDAGTLSLDQTVGALLPDLDLAASPGHLDDVTVQHLLSHQSGLWDYTPWIDGPADELLSTTTYGVFAANEYAMMPPGIAWNYSNPNFSLAGLVIETIDGRAWADIVIEDVALPLGMMHTYARRDDAVAARDDIASGFGPIFPDGIDTFDLLESLSLQASAPDWTTPDAQADHAFTRPAGLLWSTATDMAVLGGFLIDGDTDVLSEASHDALLEPHVPLYPGVDPDALGYAYGMMLQQGFFDSTDDYYDVPMLMHGGNTLSMTSTFALLPEQGIAVSILANGYGEDSTLIQAVVLEEAAAGRLPEPSAPPALFEPPSDDLAVYVGELEEPVLGTVTITLEDDALMVDVPSLTALGYDVQPELVAVYSDIFLLVIDDYPFVLSFYADQVPAEFAVNRSFVLRRVTMPGSPRLPQDAGRIDAWMQRAMLPSPLFSRWSR